MDPTTRPTWHEPWGAMLGRRFITIPVLLVATVVCIVVAPVAVTVALFHDVVARNDLLWTRCFAAFGLNIVMHTVGLVMLTLAWRPDWLRRVGVWWACTVVGWTLRLFRMRLRVEGEEVAAPPGPIAVFARHVSILDTLLPIVVVAAPHRYHLRYVVKHELLRDPCIDVMGHRQPTAFVRRGTANHAREIGKIRWLQQAMDTDEALVMFPEGTRFTEGKRRRRLAQLERNDPAMWARADAMTHVLPPRVGGPLAVLARHEADIVFMAHAGSRARPSCGISSTDRCSTPKSRWGYGAVDTKPFRTMRPRRSIGFSASGSASIVGSASGSKRNNAPRV